MGVRAMSIYVSAAVATALFLAACGASEPRADDSAVSVEPTLTSTPEVLTDPPATDATVETAPPVTTAPPQLGPTAVVCTQRDGFELEYVDLATGEVVETGGVPNSSAFDENTWLQGDTPSVMVPLHAVACGFLDAPMKERSIWNDDFTSIVGVEDTGDSSGVFVYDVLDQNRRLLVEQEGESDFGGSPATAHAAAFMPDGQSIILREQKAGECQIYIVPADGYTLRSELPTYLVGTSDRCGGKGDRFEFAGGQPLICMNSGCYDVTTNIEFEGDLDEASTPPAVPPSSKFDIRNAMVAPDGTILFIADDRDARQAFLYRWAGEGTEPVLVAELGDNSYNQHLIGVNPAAGSATPAATAETSGTNGQTFSANDALSSLPGATEFDPFLCPGMLPHQDFVVIDTDQSISIYGSAVDAQTSLEAWFATAELANTQTVTCTLAGGNSAFVTGPTSVSRNAGGGTAQYGVAYGESSPPFQANNKYVRCENAIVVAPSGAALPDLCG